MGCEIKTKVGKAIYIVDSHNEAVHPWLIERRRLNIAPILFSFDYHTDTKMAFERKLEFGGLNPLTPEEQSLYKCALVNTMDDSSVLSAISELNHDEHIDAAIKLGILNCAYIIQNQNPGTLSIEQSQWISDNFSGANFFKNRPAPTPPFTYDPPANRILIADSSYTFDQREFRDGDQALLRHFDRAIEDAHTRVRFNDLFGMSISTGFPWITDTPFILDIDLDYFNTLRSIRPAECNLFYWLIRRSAAITIAREESCVNYLARDEVTCELLLAAIENHICQALNAVDLD